MDQEKDLKKYITINENEFFDRIRARRGDFSNIIFNFPVSFRGIKKIKFSLNFNNSIFKEDIDFSRTIFSNEFLINKTVFEKDVNFFYTYFKKRMSARKATFKIRANFDLSRFLSDVDFTKAVFLDNTYFKKARFNQNVFFNKTFFYKKIDFSYAHFSDNFFTSFISINKNTHPYKISIQAPTFVFRNIFFPKKTIFNEVDLSHTTFQHSAIENIIFKNCRFLSKFKRYVFYSEISKSIDIPVENNFSEIKKNTIDTIILPKNKETSSVHLDDKIIFFNKNKPQEKETYFVVTQLEASSFQKIKSLLKVIDFRNTFTDYNDLTYKDCVPEKEKSKPTVLFRIKKYNEKKSWIVLEDTYRQLKKTMEVSRDWQGASSFYRSEMNAKINFLKLIKEQWWYRQLLQFYGAISGFGECVPRILYTMIFSVILGIIFLKLSAPYLEFDEILDKNISLFFPIFGSNTTSVSTFHFKPWQNLILYFEVIWFYILWLNLAIAVRRKLRR